MRPTSSSARQAFTIFFSLLMLLAYQNCGVKTESVSKTVNGVRFSCTPSTESCLSYKLSITNLSQVNSDKVSFQLSGNAKDGATAATLFSSNCQRINNTTAYCAYGQTVQGSISSEAKTTTNASGASTTTAPKELRVSFLTDANMQSINSSTIGAKVGGEPGELSFAPAVTLCFESDGSELRDGDFIPFSAFSECPSTSF